jgi:two-component system, OmpR family, sensor kinase
MRAVSDQVYGEEQTDRQCSAVQADRNRGQPTSREVALEAELIEVRAQLRARDKFLAVAAHELRNPMTPIAAWVELLMAQARRRPGHIPSEMLRGLERLEHLVEAYIRRATTLLDVSRISTGHLQLSPGKIDLSSLVRETVSAMIPAAQTAGCAISLAVQDGIAGSFDRTAIEQVIDNIVSNAIRYGAGQPINVVLTANENTVRLAVSDQGIGISDSDQARIFGQFQRVEGNTTGGFGVGLWITRQLVLAMEGNISVTSKPGAGSTFTVALPLKTD